MLPLLTGTLLITLIALVVAAAAGPDGRPLPERVREAAHARIIKPALEMLAGVPTVVYGYFALLFVTPLLQKTSCPACPASTCCRRGIVMGIMILPYIASLSEDAMRAVPQALRDGSLRPGRDQVRDRLARGPARRLLRHRRRLRSSALSRAVGETMIVAIAAGQQPNLTLDPREPAATITAYIVQVALGDLPHGSIGYQSIFAVGLMLFLMTLAFNILAFWLRRRFREAY